MELYFTHDLLIHLTYFQIALLAIILSNLYIMVSSRRRISLETIPFVSVLIPARNEEAKIERCVYSLLDQDYPSYEVLVLDDQSLDQTHAILQRIAVENSGITVLEGSPSPDGVLGKNWACIQLAERAKGELLLFIDADTVFTQGALHSLVQAMELEKIDLLTGYPRQILGSWGEKFLVPFFSWAMISFNSLALAYLLRSPVLASAVGQMMLFRRSAYVEIGGHTKIADSIVDDLSLARNIVADGFKWRVTYIADIISCRMYHSSIEAREGFSKNLFAVFNFRVIPFIFVFSWLIILFLWPLLLLLLSLSGQTPLADPFAVLICILFSLLLWAIPYAGMRINVLLAFLYPITIISITSAAYRSLIYTVTGKLTWKGRKINNIKWKWL